ncbi:hypothetical protein C8R46DRAFT_1294505 [Mycena filopes]|nr:hypothetical protein C8R46DRAFT_1294505 [Mycena filopes]
MVSSLSQSQALLSRPVHGADSGWISMQGRFTLCSSATFSSDVQGFRLHWTLRLGVGPDGGRAGAGSRCADELVSSALAEHSGASQNGRTSIFIAVGLGWGSGVHTHSSSLGAFDAFASLVRGTRTYNQRWNPRPNLLHFFPVTLYLHHLRARFILTRSQITVAFISTWMFPPELTGGHRFDSHVQFPCAPTRVERDESRFSQIYCRLITLPPSDSDQWHPARYPRVFGHPCQSVTATFQPRYNPPPPDDLWAYIESESTISLTGAPAYFVGSLDVNEQPSNTSSDGSVKGSSLRRGRGQRRDARNVSHGSIAATEPSRPPLR